jgi:predicted outer membrane lipoprotein
MSNIWVTWGDVFNTSLQNLWFGFVQFAPRLIVAIIFFIVGWILGSLIAKAFEQVINALKIDKLFASIGMDTFFKRIGMNLDTGYFIGQVVRWFVIIVFLLPSLNLVDLAPVSSFLQEDILGYLPRIIVAAFILIIATFDAEFISKTVVASAKAMSLHSANMLGAIARYAVWIFAFIVALGQLGVAPEFMQILFAGIVGMIAIAGALAFGLGGKDAAGRLIARLGEDMSHHKE